MARQQGFDVRYQMGFTGIAMACFVILYLPIVLLVVYSFNAGTSIAIWEGFSWRWYQSAWQNDQVQDATVRSLVIALWASAISTSAAVLAAVATTRTRKFKGQATVFALINQPLMVPEIVTAVALLIFFAMIKVATGYTGLFYLIIAHAAFCIPFAYLPIRARLQGMDLSLEQAFAVNFTAPSWAASVDDAFDDEDEDPWM